MIILAYGKQEMAALITLNCVRNSIIEDYRLQGKLTDEEMAIFTKEVLNKVYSFIELLSNPELEGLRKLPFKSPDFFYKPKGWSEPEFDDGWKKQLEAMRNENN
jgi:hypothetical protein